MSIYTENQERLAATPGGIVAAQMRPGDVYLTDNGDEVVISMGWSPDLTGESEKWAEKEPRFAFSPLGQRTEIAYSSRKLGHQRINVEKVAGWRFVRVVEPHPYVR